MYLKLEVSRKMLRTHCREHYRKQRINHYKQVHWPWTEECTDLYCEWRNSETTDWLSSNRDLSVMSSSSSFLIPMRGLLDDFMSLKSIFKPKCCSTFFAYSSADTGSSFSRRENSTLLVLADFIAAKPFSKWFNPRYAFLSKSVSFGSAIARPPPWPAVYVKLC